MITKYYDLDGNETYDPPKFHCAYQVDHDEHTNSYIYRCGSEFFNPAQAKDFGYMKKSWKFSKVGLDAFDLYVRFLKSKYRHLLTQSERLS